LRNWGRRRERALDHVSPSALKIPSPRNYSMMSMWKEPERMGRMEEEQWRNERSGVGSMEEVGMERKRSGRHIGIPTNSQLS